MLKLLACAILVAVAAAYQQGWDPAVCCYEPPTECCYTPPPCPRCVDIAFTVDISSSIGPVRFRDIIVPYLKLFATTNHWVIGHADDQYQVAITTFATTAQVQWNWLSPETSNAAMLEAAFGTLTAPQFAGLTNIGDGLQKTRLEIINGEGIVNGTGNRDQCEDVCILITDGENKLEFDKFEAEAPLFKDGTACDLSIVIGLTSQVNKPELVKVATAPEYVILLDIPMRQLNYPILQPTFDNVTQMICDGLTPQNVHEGEACCPYDYPNYFHLMGY